MESVVPDMKIAALFAATILVAACQSTPPPAQTSVELPPPASAAPPAAAPAPLPAPEPAAAPAVTPAMTASVSGNVTYRVRKALPPEAVIRVQLLDITLADEPARVLGEQTIEAKGRQVPFAYKVAYDPKAITPKNRYQVSAVITAGKEVLFMTDTALRVITGGNPKRRDIVVKPVK